MQGSFVALRPMQYGRDAVANLVDMHQVFEMRDEVNDETLLRLRYAMPLAKDSPISACGLCGAKFTSDFGLNRHGKLRHTERRGPVIKDDDLGPIDLDDPEALLARAERLRRDMKHTFLADGINAPSPEAEVSAEERADEKVINEMSPIAWDKTKAAVKANDVKVPEIVTPGAE